MNAFTNLIKNGPEYRSVAHDLQMGRFPFGILGLPPVTKSLMVHTLCEDTSHGAIVVFPEEAAAIRCRDDLLTLGTNAYYYPARSFNFYAAESSSREYEQMRISALSHALAEPGAVIVCGAEALAQRTVPPEILRQKTFSVSEGMSIPTDDFRRRLISAGYTAADNLDGDLTDRVQVTGTVDPDTPGTYKITYTVEDSYHNKTEVTRTVTVQSPRRTAPQGDVSDNAAGYACVAHHAQHHRPANYGADGGHELHVAAAHHPKKTKREEKSSRYSQTQR